MLVVAAVDAGAQPFLSGAASSEHVAVSAGRPPGHEYARQQFGA